MRQRNNLFWETRKFGAISLYTSKEWWQRLWSERECSNIRSNCIMVEL